MQRLHLIPRAPLQLQLDERTSLQLAGVKGQRARMEVAVSRGWQSERVNGEDKDGEREMTVKLIVLIYVLKYAVLREAVHFLWKYLTVQRMIVARAAVIDHLLRVQFFQLGRLYLRVFFHFRVLCSELCLLLFPSRSSGETSFINVKRSNAPRNK
jgi:hypothetical protein